MAVKSLEALGALADATLVAAGMKPSSIGLAVERVPDTVEHRAFTALPTNILRQPGNDFVEWTLDLEVRAAYLMPAFRSESASMQSMIFPAVATLCAALQAALMAEDALAPGQWSAQTFSSEDGQALVLVLRVPVTFCEETP